jgi:hypothetical protein
VPNRLASALFVMMAGALPPHGYRSCHAFMRIAAGNICGGRIAGGGAFAPPPCDLPDISASAYKPQEITEGSDIGPLDHRKLKPLVDDARRRIARCRAGRRELAESWQSNVAIMSLEADECAAREGTEEKRVTSIGKLVTIDDRSVRRVR